MNPSQLPPAAQRKIDFDRDIHPIFKSICYRCHAGEKPRSYFSLTSRQGALKGGDDGIDIIPGHSEKSPLIYYVSRLVPDMEMPPEGKGKPLTAEQIGLLRAWIDQGVPWSAEAIPLKQRLQFSMTSSLEAMAVSGNRRKFREQQWEREGVSGGVDRFLLRYQPTPETHVEAEGEAIPTQERYRLHWRYSRADVGYIQSDVRQFRSYFNDVGGYYAPFQMPAFALNRDLHLDNGVAGIEFGLTLPHWPVLAVGYEYHYKTGTKSMLEWGAVADSQGVTRSIYPAYKKIREQVHVLKFRADDTLGGVSLKDRFRGEFYDLETRKVDVDSFTLDSGSQYHEHYRHFEGANTFRAERRLLDWLYVSGGYLYSQLEGNAVFSQGYFTPSDPAAPLFLGDTSDNIVVDRDSHVFNLNALLGPWEGLSFTAGLQNEWTRQKGFASGLAFDTFPKTLSSDLDTASFEEDFDLRYQGIPYTVAYVDTRFRQESIGQSEAGFVDDGLGDASDFMRNTDFTSDLKDFRAGFTVSPWPRFSVSISGRHRLDRSQYDNPLDTDLSGLPGNGYPGFIRLRDLDTDEAETKWVWHYRSWLKPYVRYQYVVTHYRTRTDPSVESVSQQAQPGGAIAAGNYNAHNIGLGLDVRPWRRLYATTLFTYGNTRLYTGVNNDQGVTPYKGNSYSVLFNADVLLTRKLDLDAAYSFSMADYAQNNAAGGLPLGVDYYRHSAQVGLVRHLKHHATLGLHYGFFRYIEPTSGGANDYTAHAVLATYTIAWP